MQREPEKIMDPNAIIPSYQPLPFPLPVWLMQVLLIAGFYLHAMPMNVVLGGGFIGSALFFAGRRDHGSYAYRTAKALAVSLPLFISFAVTQGIVPLLFLQLLYGPAFYTSSIIMAVPWLSVLAVLLVSYYISYIVIYRVLHSEMSTGKAAWASILLLLMSAGFAAIAWMFSNNMTLMLSPQKWLSMYQVSALGTQFNNKEPQLLPRYLHFLLASIAVAGMTIGCFGLYVRKRDNEFSSWMIRIGSRIFAVSTGFQIVVGLWFLKAIPANFAAAMMGGEPIITGTFVASIILTLIALFASGISGFSANKPAFLVALTTNAFLILTMIVTRHLLRAMYLSPHLRPESVPVSTQWDLLAIFLLSTVALIAYLIWLCRTVWEAYTPTSKLTSNRISECSQASV